VKFALRDDDACYFTAPGELERVYRDVWDRVPVCLATVPFAIGYERAGIPRAHWTSGEAFPLERNGELVSALHGWLANRRVTVALHGYTHTIYWYCPAVKGVAKWEIINQAWVQAPRITTVSELVSYQAGE